MLRRALIHASTVTAYAVLAALHTYPLAVNLDSHLPGLGLGDNVSFVWNLWWMREALASPQLDFFQCPFLFVPFGSSLVLHTHTALAGVLSATLLGSHPAAQAQNILLIGSLTLNGVAAYLLANQATRARLPALAAGALFVVAPAVTGRLMGHYNLVIVWPLILACLAYVAWLRSPRWSTSVALAVAAALIAYTDYYYLVFFGLFVAAYSSIELWSVRLRVVRRDSQWISRALMTLALAAMAAGAAIVAAGPSTIAIGTMRVSARTPTNALTAGWLLAAAGAIAGWRVVPTAMRRPGAVLPALAVAVLPPIAFLVLTSPLTVGLWRMWQAGDYVTQSSSLKSGPRGVDLATVFLGPPFSGVAGAPVRGLYDRLGIDPMESSAWIGAATAVLLIAALRLVRRERESRPWLLLGVFFAVWALGPYLQLAGANTGMLLPQAAASFVPLVNNARIPGRAMVVVTLCVVILIAILLAKASPGRRFGLWLLVLVAVAESIAAPLPLAALPDVGAYEEVKADLDRHAAVLSVPFGLRDGFGEQGALQHDALYAQTTHGHGMAGGFVARVPSRVRSWYEATEPYRSLMRLSSGGADEPLPTCGQMAAGLREGGVSYVMLYRRAASAPLAAFVDGSMPLRRIRDDGRHALFVVNLERCGGPR